MRAIVYERFGGPEVLEIREMAKPELKDNELLIRTKTSSVTKYDCWQRSASAPPGFGPMARITSGPFKPKQPVIGTELAGVVEAVGKNVTKFAAGDEVIWYTGAVFGAYAEYVCAPEDATVVRKPAAMNWEEAGTMMQGALTALYFLLHGTTGEGKKVLIYGASGGVGIPAVQIAKHFGLEVTGVCSGSKAKMVKSLGAAKTVDYRTEKFWETDEQYDVILDTTGQCPVLKCKKILKRNGFYLSTTFGIPQLVKMLWFRWRTGANIYLGLLKETTEDMAFLTDLYEKGELKIEIDKVFPMEQIAEAHWYVESGAKAGNVAVRFQG